MKRGERFYRVVIQANDMLCRITRQKSAKSMKGANAESI